MKYYSSHAQGVSTPDDRAKLFDQLVEKIMLRDAFVPIKLQRLGLDVRRELLRYRDEVIAADTDEKLIYALLKVSCARKDPHVRVQLVQGGLKLEGVDFEEDSLRIDQLPVQQAPIRFTVDYSNPDDYFIFVADYATDIAETCRGHCPAVGDRLLSINGLCVGDYIHAVEPYNRYATINGLWWRLATKIPQQSREYPPHFYSDELSLTLERPSGEIYDVALSYRPDAKSIRWTGVWKKHGDHRYPGFKKALETSTYHLYTRIDAKPVIVLDWNQFDSNIMPNMDALMAFATEHDLLGHGVIVDATRSGGGSLGAYAVRHLSPKPFKTTMGNLRISDVVEDFISASRRRKDSGLNMTSEDGGNWLMDWLENDVSQAVKRGDAYSDNVPFKSSHLPKDSDGTMQPAPVHFRGPMVCLLSPHGGSHLDQFVAMLADNDLAHIIGMPAGGYSNTWEWEETLHFPISGKPVLRFMYSMGHTIRPNGELLEGNPAEVDDYIPQTRDNYMDYHALLLDRALSHLRERGVNA